MTDLFVVAHVLIQQAVALMRVEGMTDEQICAELQDVLGAVDEGKL